MYTIKEISSIKKLEDDNYSFNVQILKDNKEISGRHNITAEIKSDDVEILTPSIKLTKNTEIQFKDVGNNIIQIFIQPENAIDVLKVDFDGLTDLTELDVSEESELQEEPATTSEPEELSEDKNPEPDIKQLDKDELPTETNYPVLKQTSQIEFDFIFTSQINEILSGNIQSESTKKLFERAIKEINRIVFFRDTNTSMYYWITKDTILQDSNFTKLMIEVNEYNKG